MALTTLQVQQLYLGYYGRPADPVGLAYWQTQTLEAAKAGFAASAEFTNQYVGMSVEQQVNQVYINLLGREADLNGLLYWSNEIVSGRETIGTLVMSMQEDALGRDVTTLQMRTDFSANFTLALDTTGEVLSYSGQAAAEAARAAMANIVAASTGDTSTLTAALASLDTTVAGVVAGGGVAGQTFMLTTGADNIVGTSGNDLISGVIDNTGGTISGTFNTADTINGGAGTDVLSLVTTGNAQVTYALVPPATVSNIETVQVRSTGTGGAQIDATQFGSSVTTLEALRSTTAVDFKGLGATGVVKVTGDGTVVNGAVGFTYTTATTAPNIVIHGGVTNTGTATITNAANGATSASISSTGAANATDAITLSGNASVKTITIDAATNLTIGDTAATVGLANAALDATGATLTVTGAGVVDIRTMGAALTTVNASGNSGGFKATMNAVTTTKITGSSGNDTITTGSILTTGSVDAGAGTGDTLVLASASHLTATTGTKYTNFEVLNNADTASSDVSTISGITSLISSGAGGGFSKMTATQAAAVTNTVDQTAISYALATATGTADALSIELKNATATASADVKGLTITGFETLNVKSSSGSKDATVAAGATQNEVSFTAAADLKTINVAGDYSAIVTASNVAKVTAIDASTNTAGVSIITGNQTGSLLVTGSAKNDLFTMGAAGAGGLTTINAGAGNDKITAAQADIAVATINGGDGTDTLVISDATPTIADNSFTNVTAIEKIELSSATTLSWTVGGYANALATANGGVLDITAAALTGATTIDGSGLSPNNALKLTLTNVDTAANATATTITLSQGADNIKMTAAGASTSDTITIDGGVAALAATTAKTIDLSAVTKGGAITVTTGAGADTIKAAVGIAGTYTAGAGADTITLGAADGAAQTLKYDVANQSTTTAWDKVSNFEMVATNGDLLDFATTAVLTTAQLGATGWTVSNGIATKTGGTLAEFVTAFTAATTAGAVAFSDGTSTYVAYSDGTAATTTSDQIIELVGLTGATSVSTTVGANVIGII